MMTVGGGGGGGVGSSVDSLLTHEPFAVRISNFCMVAMTTIQSPCAFIQLL